MASRRGFRPTDRLIYSYAIAQEIAERTPDDLYNAIQKAGDALTGDNQGDTLRENFIGTVVTATGERHPDLPPPILGGVLRDYGIGIDEVLHRAEGDEDDAADLDWVVLQAALQASAAWLTPDWLRMDNYPELIDDRRWLVLLQGHLAMPLRRNPCAFEEGVRTRMQPWITKVLQPNFQQNAQAILRRVGRRDRAAQEATSAWLYTVFYSDLLDQWRSDVEKRLARARVHHDRHGKVVNVEAVPSTAAVHPRGSLPRQVAPTPQQRKRSERAGASVPAPSQPSQTQGAPSRDPAPTKTPTGDAQQPVSSWKDVSAKTLSPADWVRAIGATDWDWESMVKNPLKGGKQAKDYDRAGRLANMATHLSAKYHDAGGRGDDDWAALARTLPGADAYLSWQLGEAAPTATAPSERTQTVATPRPPVRRRTPTRREATPPRRTTRRASPRARPSVRSALPTLPPGFPMLPRPQNVAVEA